MKESNIHEEFNDDNSPYTKWIAVFGEKSNPDNKDKTSVYRDSKSYDAEIFKIEDYISEGNNLEIKTVPTYIDDSYLLKIYNEAYLYKMNISQETIDINKHKFIDRVIEFAQNNDMAPVQLLQAILQERDSSYFKSIEHNENNILYNSKEDMKQQEKFYKDSHYSEYPHGNEADIKQDLEQYYLTYQNQSQQKELDNQQNFIKKIKDSAEKNYVNADQLLSEILKVMDKQDFELMESQGIEGDLGKEMDKILNATIQEFHLTSLRNKLEIFTKKTNLKAGQFQSSSDKDLESILKSNVNQWEEVEKFDQSLEKELQKFHLNNLYDEIKDYAKKNHINPDQLTHNVFKGMKENLESIKSHGVNGDIRKELDKTLEKEKNKFHLNQYKEYINHLEATPSLDKKIQTTETEQSVSKLFLIEYLLLKYDINRDYNEKEMLLMDVSLYQKHFEKESTNKITFDETDKELINKVDISIKAQNKTNATVNKMKDSLNSKKAKDSSWFQAGKKMTSSLYSYIKGGDGKSR